MSEKLQALQLGREHYAGTTLGQREQWRRDIQDIFTPSRSKIVKFFAREAFGMLDITVKAKGVRPAYSVSTHRDPDGQINFMSNRSASRLGQAAAWATMRMYLEHPNRAGSILWQLNAVDYNEASAPRFNDLKHFREEESFVFRSGFWEPAAKVLHVEELGYTLVTAGNRGDQTLPELLTGIKNLYDELYPADMYPAADTSAAVAGIVGAREVEAFSAIWQDLSENQPDPVIAARHFLNSGVFIAADK